MSKIDKASETVRVTKTRAQYRTKTQKQKVGAVGEALAVSWLEKNNYRVIAQNVYNKAGEIDIIAQERGWGKGNHMIFFEVKTVSIYDGRHPQVSAMDNLTQHKIEKLTRTIELHMNNQAHKTKSDHKRRTRNKSWQLDALLVTIDPDKKTATVDHHPHIF